MKTLSTITGGVSAGWLAAGAALAHPGHGVAPTGTPGHAIDHLSAWLMSSPLAWLVLVAIGFLAVRRVARRRDARPNA